ncbi:ABC transporter substrate-binding protein [Alcaligenaceae bacterium]|nr:ABC transporter substrate-binding protein [Alcaligenaceae bacterium]
MKTKSRVALTAAALLCAPAIAAQPAAQPVKIGVLGDLSSIYSAIGGKGLIDAARMAVEDFGGKVLGQPIEVLYADTQNKVDIASNQARQWFDVEGVDMITDLPSSGLALAVSMLAEEKKKIVLVTSAATSDLTGKSCSPYTAHWTYDTYSTARGTGAAVMKEGGDTWHFITVDYAFGKALERDATEVIKELGGKVLGTSTHPLGAPDFSSYLLQAQSSKAKVIGLANGGNDTVTTLKQAAEFGLGKGEQKMAAFITFLTDIKAIGLPTAQGLYLTEAFYWDQNDQTRAWSQRFHQRNGTMPTMTQAGTYSAVIHYLNAIKAVGTKDTDQVMAQMRATPINDFMTTNGSLRKDGRVVRDMYLYQVKTPAESKGEWDLYKVVGTTPGEQAFRPMDQGGCKLVQ